MPLDIGVGVLLSFLVSHLFGFEANWQFICAGILFSLLVDVDILPFLWPTNYNHRSFFHYPLLYVPVTFVVYFIFGPVWATLFGLSVLSHFIHDTIGIGWGVAWLAPFSLRKFLFPEKRRRSALGFFMTWLPEEEKTIATEYHDPHWVKTYYLRPNPIAYVEYGTLLISFVVLVLYFSHVL